MTLLSYTRYGIWVTVEAHFDESANEAALGHREAGFLWHVRERNAAVSFTRVCARELWET